MMNADHTILETAKFDFNEIKLLNDFFFFTFKLFRINISIIYTHLDVLAIIVKVSVYIKEIKIQSLLKLSKIIEL